MVACNDYQFVKLPIEVSGALLANLNQMKRENIRKQTIAVNPALYM